MRKKISENSRKIMKLREILMRKMNNVHGMIESEKLLFK